LKLDKNKLIARLEELSNATPICFEVANFEKECLAQKNIVCMPEPHCINEKIRKLINDL
jgi:hypothetical protein